MAEVDQGVGVRPATTPVGGNEMAVAEEQVQPAAEVGMSPEAQAGTGAESPAGPPPEAAPPGEPNPFDETDQTGTQVGAGAAEAVVGFEHGAAALGAGSARFERAGVAAGVAP